MSLLDLVKSPGVVVSPNIVSSYAYLLSVRREVVLRCNRDVSAVEHGSPAVEGVGLERNIVSATEIAINIRTSWLGVVRVVLKIQSAGSLSNTRWTEASTWTIGRAGIEGRTLPYISYNKQMLGRMILPMKAMSYLASRFWRQGW